MHCRAYKAGVPANRHSRQRPPRFPVFFAVCGPHSTARGQTARPRGLRGSFLNETIDDLTVQYEENGQILINEVDKVVLSKGAWTTILFRYQQWRPETDDFGPDKYVIRRYKKSGGEYRQQSKFTISSAEQARKIVDALLSWIDK